MKYLNQNLFLISFLILVAFGEACAQIKANPEDILTNRLNEIYKEGLINGYGVTIVDREGVRYEKGFGFSDIKNQKPYEPTTLQNIGSVSKTLIGIALMKAQEQGKLKLDDPINKYLSFKVNNPRFPDNEITIRHLATHTSTIEDTDYYDGKAYVILDKTEMNNPVVKTLGEDFQTVDTRVSMEGFFKNLLTPEGIWYKKKNYSKKKPGTTFKYSNVAAALAAYIIEQTTGIMYDKYTTEHILKPLGMQASGWSFDTIDVNNHSLLYTDDKMVIPFYTLVTYPDGGLISSLHDMGKYLRELNNAFVGKGTLLSKESYQELFTEQLKAENFLDRDNGNNPLDDEYNTGIFMGFTPTGNVGHTGSDPSVFTYMFFEPKTGIGRIVFANTSVFQKSWKKQIEPISRALMEYEDLIKK